MQWVPLNGITLGNTITDPINQMIKVSIYNSYTKYAIERQLGFVRCGLV
jgi:hypothetical protein